MRLLPRGLREPVGLAYLLARATDTVADTVQIPAEIREEALRNLVQSIREPRGGALLGLETEFAPLQTNEAERVLIESLPEILRHLGNTEPGDAGEIRVVLEKITRAQLIDIKHFSSADEVRALETAEDLGEYTYLIAGSVGEFWTRLCFRHTENFADRPEHEMLELGKAYGDGLQLVNILRDTGSDLSVGRCYFPADELAGAGLTPSQIRSEPARFEPIFRKWLNEAEGGLRAGMEYVRAIRPRRIRAATALPALIGIRTVALLRQAGARALHERIKVPRNEVRRMIVSSLFGSVSREHLATMFARLGNHEVVGRHRGDDSIPQRK